MHLSAANILKALQSYLEKQEITIDNSSFFMMDTANLNSGEKSGLKRLLKHVVPMLPGLVVEITKSHFVLNTYLTSFHQFTEIKYEEFTATILMLCDVFNAVQPLNLVLQKGNGNFCFYNTALSLVKSAFCNTVMASLFLILFIIQQ